MPGKRAGSSPPAWLRQPVKRRATGTPDGSCPLPVTEDYQPLHDRYNELTRLPNKAAFLTFHGKLTRRPEFASKSTDLVLQPARDALTLLHALESQTDASGRPAPLDAVPWLCELIIEAIGAEVFIMSDLTTLTPEQNDAIHEALVVELARLNVFKDLESRTFHFVQTLTGVDLWNRSPSAGQAYWEPQSELRCAQHALNNLWEQRLLELNAQQAATGNDMGLVTSVPAGDGMPMQQLSLPAWMLPTVMESLLETSRVVIYQGDPRKADDQGHFVGVRRKPDGTHELLDSLRAGPEPVDARALYETSARRAGVLLCAVPGGRERPDALMRYDRWMNADGHEQIGQALTDVLGRDKLKEVIGDLMAREAAWQQAAASLPRGATAPPLSLVIELISSLRAAGYEARGIDGSVPSVGIMRELSRGLEYKYEQSGLERALLCTRTYPMLLPVFRDAQGTWQARVAAQDGGDRMVTRALDEVMTEQQATWDERRSAAQRIIREIDELPPEQRPSQQERKAEALESLREIDEQRLMSTIIIQDQWPKKRGNDIEVSWNEGTHSFTFSYVDPFTGTREAVRSLQVKKYASQIARDRTKASLDEYARCFDDEYGRTGDKEKARAAAEVHLRAFDSVNKRPPRQHVQESEINRHTTRRQLILTVYDTDPATDTHSYSKSIKVPQGDAKAEQDAREKLTSIQRIFNDERKNGRSVAESWTNALQRSGEPIRKKIVAKHLSNGHGVKWRDELSKWVVEKYSPKKDKVLRLWNVPVLNKSQQAEVDKGMQEAELYEKTFRSNFESHRDFEKARNFADRYMEQNGYFKRQRMASQYTSAITNLNWDNNHGNWTYKHSNPDTGKLERILTKPVGARASATEIKTVQRQMETSATDFDGYLKEAGVSFNLARSAAEAQFQKLLGGSSDDQARAAARTVIAESKADSAKKEALGNSAVTAP